LLNKARKISEDSKDPLIELSGSSLNVYMLLLKNRKPLTIREIQRMLGFKSPNSVRHHIDRLMSLGFVKRTRYGYIAVKPKNSLFNLLIELRGILIPKQIFTLIVSILLTIGYIIVYSSTLNPYVIGSFIVIDILILGDIVRFYDKLRRILKYRR
jgi:predicted DNA-binding transcriptional regulator